MAITDHPDVQRLIAKNVELQAENKRLEDEIFKYNEELSDAQTENARLREALEYQAKRHDSICREYDSEWGCNCGAKKAQEALKETGK